MDGWTYSNFHYSLIKHFPEQKELFFSNDFMLHSMEPQSQLKLEKFSVLNHDSISQPISQHL